MEIRKFLGIVLGLVLISGSIPISSFSQTEEFSDSDNLETSSSTQMSVPKLSESKRQEKFDDGFYEVIQNKITQRDEFSSCLENLKFLPHLNNSTSNGVIITSSSTGTIFDAVDQLHSKTKIPKIKEKISDCIDLPFVDSNMTAEDTINKLEYHDVVILLDKTPKDGQDRNIVSKKNKIKIENVLRDEGVTSLYKAKMLSFVTASVPVEKISSLADYDFVKRMGNGEKEIKVLFANMDEAKVIVNATQSFPVDGTGIKVGVIDVGIMENPYHTDLPQGTKIVYEASCDDEQCNPNVATPDNQITFGGHGTRNAGIIAGLGLTPNEDMKGIAPGASILDMKITSFEFRGFLNALDTSLRQGASVSNISLQIGDDSCASINTLLLIMDEAVDEGHNVVIAAGNPAIFNLETVHDMACAFNPISVGAVDSNGLPMNHTIAKHTARGPTFDGRLKPEITAPGVEITSTDLNGNYSTASGTSHAAPFVSGAAALLLDAHPEFSPLEVKSALLLGANWKGPNTITAETFDFFGINQTNPGYIDLNTYGFGILNIGQSLDYADGNHIIRDSFSESGPTSKQYSFDISSSEVLESKHVKIILSWLKHPNPQELNLNNLPTDKVTSNLDLTLELNNFTQATSKSFIQNNEFIVFNATSAGTYTINVDATTLLGSFDGVETFSLASTQPFTSSPTNTIPTVNNTPLITTTPQKEIPITLTGNDLDGDQLTFYIDEANQPQKGSLSSIIPLGQNSARIFYTANSATQDSDSFQFFVYDGKSSSLSKGTVSINIVPPGSIGPLLVSSFGTSEVKAYNIFTGDFESDFVTIASGGLSGPFGLAYGPDDNLYVASSITNQVLRYDGQDGSFISPPFATGDTVLDDPRGIAFGADFNSDGKEDLYVANDGDDDVVVFQGPEGANPGAFIGIFGEANKNDSELDTPAHLRFDSSGNLYVSSRLDDNVRKYSSSGTHLGEFAVDFDTLDAAYGIDFDTSGDLYVSSGQKDQVVKFDGSTGNLDGVFTSVTQPNDPRDLIFGPDKNNDNFDELFVGTDDDDNVMMYDGDTGAFIEEFVLNSDGGLKGASGLVFQPPINHRPVANNDSVTATEGISINIDVLDNDIDADADILNVTSVNVFGTMGNVTNNGNDVSFVSNSLGATTFSYIASDGTDDSNSAIVTVVVTAQGSNPCTPVNGDWIISSSCTLASSTVIVGNVQVENNSILTIPNGVTLDINFTSKHLLVKSGSGVLIINGGTVT